MWSSVQVVSPRLVLTSSKEYSCSRCSMGDELTGEGEGRKDKRTTFFHRFYLDFQQKEEPTLPTFRVDLPTPRDLIQKVLHGNTPRFACGYFQTQSNRQPRGTISTWLTLEATGPDALFLFPEVATCGHSTGAAPQGVPELECQGRSSKSKANVTLILPSQSETFPPPPTTFLWSF